MNALRLVLLLLLCCGPTSAALAQGAAPFQMAPGGKVAATAVTIIGDASLTQVQVDLTAPVDVNASALLNPNRMILDLPEVVFAASSGATSKGQGLVANFRYGMFMAGRSRIVLDLSGPARVESVQSLSGPAGARLVVRLVPSSATEFETAARAAETRRTAGQGEALSALPNAGAPPSPPVPPPTAGERPLVVIDPGHGGIDSGATTGKELEKSIVLQFGLMLRDKLQASGKVRVEMTREDDTFVALGDRVKFSRDRRASLFVSVHADTLQEGAGVRGATVYTNAERASDERSARLAEKENRADLVAGIESSEEQSEVADILFDLTRRETRALSSHFALTLVKNLQRTVRTNRNPLRSAGFKVLKAHDLPSVLLELGYLSNGEDVALMTSESWRQAATTAVADAILRYLAQPPDLQAKPAAP